MTVERKVKAAGVYRVGDAVRHARLGLGEVVAAGDGKVVVRFKEGEGGCIAIDRMHRNNAGGGRCKGVAIDGSEWCHAHHPDRAEQRSRAARKGGQRGGRGRPGADLADLKREVRTVIDSVLAGRLAHGSGAVALQGFNVLLRAAKVELDIREQTELIERLKVLERAAEGQRGGRWGA